ncbi:MAG TPA: hypothetical protein VK511_06810, partial [Gemmatimonadaceae bacterium]|nr:hypothetical protein [Gemmatimonadaceae bacterium]
MKKARENPPLTHDGAAKTAEKGGADSVSTRASGSIEVYRADFERQPAGPDWLQALREQGMARFQALGFPTTKNEDWHFTSVAPISERTFPLAVREVEAAPTDRRESSRRKADAAGPAGLKQADIDRFNFGEKNWHTLVFVNGGFSEGLSSRNELGNGIRVSSLADAIKSGT